MIRLATVHCSTCGRPHVTTLKALIARPSCPFCGERVSQAATPAVSVRKAA